MIQALISSVPSDDTCSIRAVIRDRFLPRARRPSYHSPPTNGGPSEHGHAPRPESAPELRHADGQNGIS
jgi:hypothetical protein